MGQPCLTLEQYASHHRQGSPNVTLTIESGNHFLQSSELQFGQYSNRINGLTVNTEHPGAKVVYNTSPRGYVYNHFYAQYNIQINGITFIGSSVRIAVYFAQEVVINNCSFRGVSFSLRTVNNAIFSRCTFSDYRRYHRTDGVIFVGPNGALSIHDSTSVLIIRSNFTNNDVALYGRNYLYSSRVLSLHIQESIFINNTSEFKGGAVHLTDNEDHNQIIVSVNRSIFFNNTASQSGGAMYLDVEYLDFSIMESSFIQNSAGSCGVLAMSYYHDTSIAQITGTTFDSNKANTGGGALCMANTSAEISNCIFTGNTAVGNGGAMVSHDSIVVISDTIFHSNMAEGDGGAIISNAQPSDYTISQSIFTHNQAGDDGGAIFIGHRESYVTLDQCTFTDNHATDRGGAITIFGSTLEITGTSFDNNRAALGETFSSCNSNIMTSIYGHGDINCSYDGPTSVTDHFNTTESCQNQSFINITLDVSIGNFCIEYRPPEPTIKEVNTVAMAAYASLSITAIVVIAFLLCFSIEKLVRSKIKCVTRSTVSVVTPFTQSQPEPLYAEATVEIGSDNVEMIEMKPNVLYGKCEPQNQACSQPQETTPS
jgi:predicted outer membrane repeat protein